MPNAIVWKIDWMVMEVVAVNFVDSKLTKVTTTYPPIAEATVVVRRVTVPC